MSFEQQNNQTNPNETVDLEEKFSAFEEVNDVTKGKKQDAKPFLSSAKGIISLAAAASILISSVGFVLWDPFHWLNAPESEEDPSTTTTSEEDSTITVLDKSNKGAVVIQRVDVKNQEDSFSILYNKKESLFYIKGYADLLLRSEKTEMLQEYTSKLYAIDKVNTVKNLKTYGLDKPKATATITYTDKSKAILYIGNETPSQDGYYVKTSLDEQVYIFESAAVELFTSSKNAFIDIYLITAPNIKDGDTNGKAVLKEISYTGKNYPSPLVLRRSFLSDGEAMGLFSYIIEKPYMRGTSDDVSNTLGTFNTIYAEQALLLHPTAKEKAAAGFNDPLAVLTITMAVETGDETNEDTSDDIVYYNTITNKLTIGSMHDDDYVVMVDGIDAIFLVNKSAFSGLADRTYENSVNPLLFLKSITEIGRISVTIDGKTHDFKLNHYPNKEDMEEQLKISVGNKFYGSDDFRTLYEMLMGMERYGTSDAKPQGKPAMSLQVYETDGSLYLSADYHSLDGNLCLVKTSEGEVFTTRWGLIDHLSQQFIHYLNGEEVVNWS